MPKDKIKTNGDGIEVAWAQHGQLVTITIDETVQAEHVDADGTVGPRHEEHLNAMWQVIDPGKLDQLIEHLRRARKHAFD